MVDISKLGLTQSDLTKKMAKISKVSSPLSGVLAKVEKQTETMRRLGRISSAYQDQLKILNQGSKAQRAIEENARRIKDIQRSMVNTYSNSNPKIPKENFTTPEIRIPPNPILETNRRLANIEERFDKMEALTIDGAKIAANIQESASDFLVQFDHAAASNDRATKRMILLAFAALLVAVIVPAYSELWKEPHRKEATREVVQELRTEIATLRKTQNSALRNVSEALIKSNDNLTVVLKDIKQSLTADKRNKRKLK